MLLLSSSGLCGAGIAPPELYPRSPFGFYDDTLPMLYDAADLGASVDLRPSLRHGLISYRLQRGGIPVGPTRAAGISLLAERLVTLSLSDYWRGYSSANCIRRARADGSLLPTIYLPLEMPSFIAGAIGEGGQIDISGHQKITLSGISHVYPDRPAQEGERRSSFPDLKMEQELRVLLDGTIGEKVHVSVDHDSERQFQPENRISLTYDGYDDEVIQSIEMGDVSLAITGPEFVSYSIPHEGLFGAKMIAQVGPVDVTVIASKEASSTESAEFVGQATAVTDTILDIYPADNYFFLMYPDTVLEQHPRILDLRVFVDDLDATNNDETGAVHGIYFTGNDPLSPADTVHVGEGDWDELQPGPGEDFVLSSDSLFVRFLAPMSDNYRIAVWLETEAGEIGNLDSLNQWELKLIKNDNPLVSDPTWQNELRCFYYLGANNIVQESFECDIYFAPGGQDPVSTQEGTPLIEVLGLDTNGDGSLADEQYAVDWDNGFLLFPVGAVGTRPFDSEVLLSDNRNPDIYTVRNPVPADSKYFIRVGYRAASTTYSLGHINIVPGSERVVLTVDGIPQTLTRDTDYTIIYEIGLLTLIGEAAEEALDPGNSLKVSFEYLPFLSAQQKFLVGTRAVYGLGDLSWLGGTMMFESASSSEERPRVGEESTRTFVADLDGHFETRPAFMTDLANRIPLVNTDAESRLALSGEVAASFPDPNTLGRAYVDDMEGSESSFPLGSSRLAWRFGGSPWGDATPAGSIGDIRWYNNPHRWDLGDIVPGTTGSAAYEDVSSLFEIFFQPASGLPGSWGSIMRCLDRYGVDFSRKTHIRLYVRCTSDQAELYLDLGEAIDEDSWWRARVGDDLQWMANGTLDTEDADGSGELDSSEEDTGYDHRFSPQEPGYSPSNDDPNQDDYATDISSRSINGTEGNGVLDTEDLNGNGNLDRANTFFRVRIPLDDPDYILEENPENGWKLIEVPLNDSTLVFVPQHVTGEPTWEKVCFARLWVSGFVQSDTLQIYDLSMVGNRWEPIGVASFETPSPPPLPFERITVSTKNNRDNQDYAADPPPGIDPGEDDEGNPRLEQSLVLKLEEIQPSHEASARQQYYSSEDYTAYSSLRMLVHGDGAEGEFFFRLGRDSLNYYEINAPLADGWTVLEARFDELTSVKEIMRARSDTLSYLRIGNIAVRGNPNLGDVMHMNVGVRNVSGTNLTSEVWVDDITLHGTRSETGFAKRVTANLELADLLLLNGDLRDIDEEFHGLGSSSGQGRHTTDLTASATLNLHRFTPPLWALSAPGT
ncbi:hypothetical protein JW921_02545, partial [Candidatus Fermentibacterales bacterium]|nr:hypothetical protein [Candidatus Fermentibacterales bacterium]